MKRLPFKCSRFMSDEITQQNKWTYRQYQYTITVCVNEALLRILAITMGHAQYSLLIIRPVVLVVLDTHSIIEAQNVRPNYNLGEDIKIMKRSGNFHTKTVVANMHAIVLHILNASCMLLQTCMPLWETVTTKTHVLQTCSSKHTCYTLYIVHKSADVAVITRVSSRRSRIYQTQLLY